MTTWFRGTLTTRRILTLVATWAFLYLLFLWLGLHPQPLGLFGIVGFVMLAYSAYTSPQSPWPAPVWHRPSMSTRQPNRTDGRLRFIRRNLESAVDTQDKPNADLNARRLQELMREVTRDQLQASPGRQVNTLAELRSTLDGRATDLRAYLFADPAPHLRLRQLQDLVERIEHL
ncbi:hypothetical protein [Leekyejoonella antrihumi]|uniref:Uncharacterized protein n=1 Tax=Leekyejoonella antrihumi TaxID=1660198 RepID=A0A563E551_9MICO|nr:hypothetical protein [Leekyejoonella antrihumi]TWP37657.1 hypothetical protein FGL98_05465 [Leekyejoonella antrihumi]